MSEGLRSNLIKYGAGFLVCGAMSWMYLSGYDLDTLSAADKYRVLCDAFTTPGVMAVLVGLLLVVSNEGAFHGVGYAMSCAVKILTPGGRSRMESYRDYRERQSDKKIVGFGFLFVIGAVFLAVAAVFMVLFYKHFQ